MLYALTPSALFSLPCDTHYLGTLGHVARAALRLGELSYAEATFTLLEPFATHFSVQGSLYCEGAVPQLLGMIAHALGRESDAITQLERGIAMSDGVGFVLRSIEGRLALARCLAARGGVGDHKRARTLRRHAQDAAARIGLSKLGESVSLSPFALPVALAADTR